MRVDDFKPGDLVRVREDINGTPQDFDLDAVPAGWLGRVEQVVKGELHFPVVVYLISVGKLIGFAERELEQADERA